LQKEDSNWVKKCMEYKVEGRRPRGRPKISGERWCKDCQASGLNGEDAVDHSRRGSR